MLCYDCSKNGKDREAVGLCHNCSAGLCVDHACLIADPLTAMYPVVREVVLPKKARQLLCATCLGALRQIGVKNLEAETSKECCSPLAA
jgi:hypothetical protein